MSIVKDNMQRLINERAAAWGKAGQALADIAAERAFTADEQREFDAAVADFDGYSQRIKALEPALEQERYLEPFAAELGGKREAEQAATWRNLDGGERAALGRGESIRQHPVFQRAERSREGRQGEVAEANYGDLGSMMRALAVGGAGSAVVPTAWSADLIDRARGVSAIGQAGATVIPMDAGTVKIGRRTGDATAAFRGEGAAIAASDPTFDTVTLEAKTLSALVVSTLEWWQDAAPSAEELVVEALARAMADTLDLAALYGGITAGAGAINLPTPPNPRGILAALTAERPANVIGAAAANGTAPTRAAGLWNEVIDTYYTVADSDETPNALIWSSRLARIYARSVDTTGQPLGVPPIIDKGVQQLIVNKVPSYTKGTMPNANDLFMGDFKQLLIGQRLQFELRPLGELYAAEGKYGVVVHWRGDIKLARPSAFAVHRALGISNS